MDPGRLATLPRSPGSMLAMETLARLVMLDREKEVEIGMLKQAGSLEQSLLHLTELSAY